MSRQFEVFTGRFKPASSKTMRVTLNKRGVFSLNSATYAALGQPKFVELLYDRASKVIGLRPTEETTKHAYPVRSQRNAKSYLVGAMAFYQAYDLDVGEGLLAFDPALEDGVLILEQENATAIPTRSRRNGKGDPAGLPLE
jgi:hypothetical protein